MTLQPLPNYLLTYRKRSALSQGEVAYLLGAQNAANVCRHERFFRAPDLQAALAYEVIFGRSISELFPGLFEQAQREVKARAKQLEQKKFNGSSRLAARRRQVLAGITARELKGQLK